MEWKNCFAPGRDEAWQLIQLQNNTPEDCNLSNVETLDDAWEKELNRKEQEELRMLMDCVTYDQENQCVHVTYPTIGDMSELKDNHFQVVGMAARHPGL